MNGFGLLLLYGLCLNKGSISWATVLSICDFLSLMIIKYTYIHLQQLLRNVKLEVLSTVLFFFFFKQRLSVYWLELIGRRIT